MSTYNIPAVLVANIVGIVILFIIAVSNFWRYKEQSVENKCLVFIFVACFVNCVVDPIACVVDGKAGFFCRILVFLCNSLLYLDGMVIGISWIHLISVRLNVKLIKGHKIVLFSVFGVVVALLLVNLFVPVMFKVDDANVYSRVVGYWIYNTCYFGFMLYGIVMYFVQRHASGGLKFFPVWMFVVPVFLGVSIQTVDYTITTANVFICVSLCGVVLCLQNEFMHRDKLTGLYNRFYLNMIEKRLKRLSSPKYSAIMLDINGFKTINDTYGHNAGDFALVKLSSLLVDSVDRLGEVIRFAGDEFILLLNTQDEQQIQQVIDNVNRLLDEFNQQKTVPYELSVAAGYCKIDLKYISMDEFLDKIDELMYEDKREYYSRHSRRRED